MIFEDIRIEKGRVGSEEQIVILITPESRNLLWLEVADSPHKWTRYLFSVCYLHLCLEVEW